MSIREAIAASRDVSQATATLLELHDCRSLAITKATHQSPEPGPISARAHEQIRPNSNARLFGREEAALSARGLASAMRSPWLLRGGSLNATDLVS